MSDELFFTIIVVSYFVVLGWGFLIGCTVTEIGFKELQ